MASALSASARGASYLILIQVTSRALTFAINQILIRYLSPDLVGASTQLELYSISVLYFARESLRVALQRQTGQLQAIVNASYLSIFLGLPLTFGLAYLYIQSSLPAVAFIIESLQIYGLATLIELLSEPCFVVTQQKLEYKTRALAETLGATSRCVGTVLTILWFHRQGKDAGVLPFAFGQLGYAIILFAVYFIRTRPIARADHLSLFMKPVVSTATTKGKKPGRDNEDDLIFSYFPKSLLNLATNIYLQSGIKYVLTQGDSILITSMTTLAEQGAYALASNYGGLIARMIFQPIEESSRNLFAKLATTTSSKKDSVASSKINVSQARDTLRDILKLYSIVALTAFAVGPRLAPLLLQVVAGKRWAQTGAGDVLATYCYYIPLLAVNGVTEAFVAAVASSQELRKQSVFMTAFFVSFASAAVLFLRILNLGARGLVLANCVNMLCRIIWNTSFIRTYFSARDEEGFSLSTTLPNSTSISLAIATYAVLEATARSQILHRTLIERLVRDGFVAAVFAGLLLVLERGFIIRSYKVIFSSGGQQDGAKKIL